MRAVGQALGHQVAHAADLRFAGRPFHSRFTQHEKAHRCVADHRRDVEAQREGRDRVEIIGEGLKGPGNPRGEHVRGHPLDVLEGLRHQRALIGVQGRDPEPAVPGQHGGDAMPAGRSEFRVPEHLRVVMCVRVDEAGCEDQSGQIDSPPGCSRRYVTHLGDVPAVHLDIGLPGRRSGTVGYPRSAENQILLLIHCHLLPTHWLAG